MKKMMKWQMSAACLLAMAVAHGSFGKDNKMIYSLEGRDMMRNVTDEVFLKTLREDLPEAMLMLPMSVTQIWRVQYATAEDGFRLAADLYYKDKKPEKLRPAVIYVHGGAWTGRGKLAADRQASWFALKENYFVAAMYYRLAQEATYPAAVHDLKCCIRWIRSIADDYSIDPDKIVLVGSSAGTQVSFMTAATAGDPEAEGPNDWYKDYSSKPNLLVLLSPALNVKLKGDSPDGFTAKYIGGTIDEVPELYDAASPLENANKDIPPTLIIQGDQDPWFPGSPPVCEKLNKLGVPCELVVKEGLGHGLTPEEFVPSLETARDFINKHLNSE